MPRFFEATCQNFEVKIGDVIVPDAVILSEGKAASAGFVILSEDTPYYLGKTSPDLDSTLGYLKSAIDGIQGVISALQTALTTDNAAFTAAIATTTSALATLETNVQNLQDNLK